MGFDPNLVFYACVAKGTIVLAEFNSKDHQDLGLLALKCLTKTPLFHTTFSHTIRGKTYTFLIQEPFTYFTICDESLETSHGLAFLESVKTTFADVVDADVGDDGWSKRKLDKLGSHCFQGEFSPVFHKLLSRGIQVGSKFVYQRNGSMEEGRGKVPLLEGHLGVKKKRKKMIFLNDLFWIRRNKDGGGERKVDVFDRCDDDDDDDDDGDGDSRMDYSKRNRGVSMNQRGGLSGSVDAKKSWKKHVWIVLFLDLIICLVLFSVWLWVCRGFKCIDR